MCGIVGSVEQNSLIDLTVLEAQCDALHHRGPDNKGIWFNHDQRVGLGSCRLAIQDLSLAGHMPMSDLTGQVWIVFNGEIYNFKQLANYLEKQGYSFHSNSDTEIILAAYQEWGTDCLTQLNGMFAFAIYDDRPSSINYKTLFLARDRVGEKPLYYWHHTKGLSFASELKALMVNPAFSRSLNLSSLRAYLTLGYIPGDTCILQHVKKLPPAHALIYNSQSGAMRIWQYWFLPQPPLNDRKIEVESLGEELENLLLSSVRQRLIADVPVGILLSGGLDSSLITAMAAKSYTKKIKTFTITFPGQGHFDESPYARQIADYFCTDHHELIAEPITADLLPYLAAQYDEPLADSSLIPTFLVSRLTKQHVSVALGGDGGDELFGGYRHYTHQLKMLQFGILPRFIRNLIADEVRRLLPIGTRGRNYLSSLGGDLARAKIRSDSYFDIDSHQFLLSKDIGHILDDELDWLEKYVSLINIDLQLIEQMTRFDFASYLPDDILVKVDRASMAISLEMRSPWLDQKIIEFAFGKVPIQLKATNKERKILLRLLAQNHLPPDFDVTRKQGFSLPLVSWFQGEWGNVIESILSECDPKLFNPKAITNLIKGQRQGLSNTSRLFALTMFELWRREYSIQW